MSPEAGICARANSKIVIRIETVKAKMSGGNIIIDAVGMVRTGAMIRGGGELVRRNPNHVPNSDGLLEYEFHSEAPGDYKGDKLKSVKATLKESNVPAGVKGVRIYAQYNEKNGMLPASTKEARAPKKKEFASSREESVETEEKPATKKEKSAKKQPTLTEEEPALKKEQPAAAKKEPAVTKEKPSPKKEEAARTEEGTKKKSRWWNPFRRKTVPASQVSATPPESKKKVVPPTREEVTPRKEATPKREEVALKSEENEKKGRSWNWNPFRRKTAAAPQMSATPGEAKKRETVLTKVPTATPSPAVKAKEKVAKKEEEKEEAVEEKKKSRWRYLNPVNWNPFRREPAEPEPNR